MNRFSGAHLRLWLLPLVAGLAVFLAGLVAGGGRTGIAQPAQMPDFIGASVCADCHTAQTSKWRDSHHGWALRKPSPENVLGDFGGVEFEHKGIKTRFITRDGKYLIETPGSDGKPAIFEVVYTIGVTPLQQYLFETEKGHLQVLDIAWDVDRKRWFPVFPDQEAVPGNGLHWTGPYKNWQARCAECHQTGFEKGFDPKTHAYSSKWKEDTVSCESCHGPGGNHAAWAKDPDNYDPTANPGMDKQGLTVPFGKTAQEKELQICSPCHSRREPFGTDSPPAGAPFADHYNLALLRNGLYHADGQINDEVYVMGSFLQSKMHAKGVTCSNCHDPHSLELKASGNAVCSQCHSPAGNADFPSLQKKIYDAPSHHHHEEGSAAAQCVNCHMPEKKFMVVDGRRDHSFQVPRPDISVKTGTPDVCVECHEGKSVQWADDAIKSWFPSSRSGQPHFAIAFSAARAGDLGAENAASLLAIAEDITAAPIVRASALDLLRDSTNPQTVAGGVALLNDESDLVREAAVKLFRRTAPASRFKLLAPLLSDARKSVRISAARELLGIPLARFPEEARGKVRAANREFQETLLARSDFPETQVAIAGLALTMRNTAAAKGALREALAMDPQLGDAWQLLARIEMAEGNPGAARKSLDEALLKLPQSANLQFSMARTLTQQNKDAEALEYFAKTAKLLPDDEAVQIEWATALTRLKRYSEALNRSQIARNLVPENPTVLALIAVNQLNLGELKEAREIVRTLTSQFPRYELTPQLEALKSLP
jgi:tetratricopeptide (TPR) repeat protein